MQKTTAAAYQVVRANKAAIPSVLIIGTACVRGHELEGTLYLVTDCGDYWRTRVDGLASAMASHHADTIAVTVSS